MPSRSAERTGPTGVRRADWIGVLPLASGHEHKRASDMNQTSGSRIGGAVEEALFGTTERAAIEHVIRAFCETHLDAGVGCTLFRATSVGAVFGLELDDTRRVVVKVHRPQESPRQTLQAIHRVQEHLWRNAFPCPRPLVGATPMANGLATAEEMVRVASFGIPTTPLAGV